MSKPSVSLSHQNMFIEWMRLSQKSPTAQEQALQVLGHGLVCAQWERWSAPQYQQWLSTLPWDIIPPVLAAQMAIATANPMIIGKLPVDWSTLIDPIPSPVPASSHQQLWNHTPAPQNHVVLNMLAISGKSWAGSNGPSPDPSLTILAQALVTDHQWSGNTIVPTTVLQGHPIDMPIAVALLACCHQVAQEPVWDILVPSLIQDTPQVAALTLHAFAQACWSARHTIIGLSLLPKGILNHISSMLQGALQANPPWHQTVWITPANRLATHREHAEKILPLLLEQPNTDPKEIVRTLKTMECVPISLAGQTIAALWNIMSHDISPSAKGDWRHSARHSLARWEKTCPGWKNLHEQAWTAWMAVPEPQLLLELTTVVEELRHRGASWQQILSLMQSRSPPWPTSVITLFAQQITHMWHEHGLLSMAYQENQQLLAALQPTLSDQSIQDMWKACCQESNKRARLHASGHTQLPISPTTKQWSSIQTLLARHPRAHHIEQVFQQCLDSAISVPVKSNDQVIKDHQALSQAVLSQDLLDLLQNQDPSSWSRPHAPAKKM